MKKILLLCMCLLTITIGWAQERRIIPYAELPSITRQFVEQHFPSQSVSTLQPMAIEVRLGL